MGKNIVIISRKNSNDTPFCSFVYNHAKALVKEGCHVTAIIVNNFFPFIKKKNKFCIKEIDGIKIIYCSTIGFSNILYNSRINLNGLSCYLRIKKIVKKLMLSEKIDLIDAHYFKNEGYAAALLKRKYGIKTYVTLHGTSFNRNFISKNGQRQIKWVGKIIDRYCCVSKKIYNQLDSLNIQNKIIVYNGIVPFKVNYNNNNHNICTLGSLIELKNIGYIIDEFYLINHKYSDAKLYIIGDGPLKEKLINQAEKFNIIDKVIFKGQIENEEVYKILSNCNVFALLSKPEGFGIAYCEAMYSGCIAIGTKGEGIDGYIVDGSNGFLIEPEETKLFEKVDYIFNNDCEVIRKRGMVLAKKTTWDENAKKYME